MVKLDDEEITLFIKNKLKLDLDWKTKFEEDKWALLKQIYKKFRIEIYFQSMSVVLEKKVPSRESSVNKCLKGIGGACIDNNHFLLCLLKGIGYDAYGAGGDYFQMCKNPLNHYFCVVRGDNGELWGVDGGCCNPTHQFIPLHEIPKKSYVMNQGGFDVEIRLNKEKNYFEKAQLLGAYMKGEYDDGKLEDVIKRFTIEPVEYEEFIPTMTGLFTDTTEMFFNIGLAFFRYLEISDDDESYKAVVVWGLKVAKATEKGTERTLFSSYEEMWPTVHKYFPLIQKNDYDKAALTFENKNKE